MTVIYEDEYIRVALTGRDYDFDAIIENLMNIDLVITFNGCEEDYIIIEADNWVGILADEYGYENIENIKNGNFIIESYDDWKIDHSWLVD